MFKNDHMSNFSVHKSHPHKYPYIMWGIHYKQVSLTASYNLDQHSAYLKAPCRDIYVGVTCGHYSWT